MEYEKEPVKPSFHIDPKAPQDVTLHLEMDVTEDIEEEFEEFSKLRRIGHFNAAKRYFEEHLESCIDNAYVLDQYGQFLWEISDVHTLTKLAREYPTGDLDNVASANWFLVCERAHQFDGDIGPQRNRDKRPNLRRLLRSWPNLDSTELQCLINDLRVVKATAGETEHSAAEYGELYAYLQHEDRIWDFRDLCYGLLALKSVEGTIHFLFSKHLSSLNDSAAGVIQIIQQHWEGSDEVTYLALLDIFTAFTMEALDAANSQYEKSLDDSEKLHSAKTYLKTARHYANQVLRQNPLNLRSRPYLQWVFVKILVEKSTDTARYGQVALLKYLGQLRGSTQMGAEVFRGLLPFRDTVNYLPNQDEAPDWQPDSSITFSHKQETAIKMVARHARELGDVMLEAACLQQLLYSSPNPEVHLVDLCNLWRSVGNRSGLTRAHLYRYILKRSPDASNALRSDLLELGDIAGNKHLQIARFMILRALSTRSFEKTVYLNRAQDLDDELHRDLYDRGASPQPLDIETIRKSPRPQNSGNVRGQYIYLYKYNLLIKELVNLLLLLKEGKTFNYTITPYYNNKGYYNYYKTLRRVLINNKNTIYRAILPFYLKAKLYSLRASLDKVLIGCLKVIYILQPVRLLLIILLLPLIVTLLLQLVRLLLITTFTKSLYNYIKFLNIKKGLKLEEGTREYIIIKGYLYNREVLIYKAKTYYYLKRLKDLIIKRYSIIVSNNKVISNNNKLILLKIIIVTKQLKRYIILAKKGISIIIIED
ncbi:hypothetical protein LX32DRAFT_656492 [Colletotrichum zoysiae]|uniref:Uncharacterized protein n=1 Tax=Colletotrichum zoysiae TaxID=1216348 RepID=A0AAD9H9T3_9PEZI|nr:hypothetical protein LX32DRAFT_656492 [Colletotrichum zoysiae]